mgnify:CR=1 FL=1
MRKLTSNPKDFGRVAVLFGGWSAERQVSLWSGQGVLEALRKRGVDAVGVDADRDTILNLGKQGYDRVFSVLHGTGGEDGTVWPKNSINLSRRLKAAGAESELKIYPRTGHVGIVTGLAKPFRGDVPVLKDVAAFAHRLTAK